MLRALPLYFAIMAVGPVRYPCIYIRRGTSYEFYLITCIFPRTGIGHGTDKLHGKTIEGMLATLETSSNMLSSHVDWN
jgi:hypothetical protein